MVKYKLLASAVYWGFVEPQFLYYGTFNNGWEEENILRLYTSSIERAIKIMK